MRKIKSYEDYKEMDQVSREFAQKLLFLGLIETVIHNRNVEKGPQMIQEIINNDIREYERVLNYEVCWLYSDTRNRFQADITQIDEGYPAQDKKRL